MEKWIRCGAKSVRECEIIMPKIDIKSIEGRVVGEMELPDDIFSVPYNPYPVKEVIRAQLAGRSKGTHKTKTRAEIKASTRKLYRQKGTGHARAGSARSPLRRGGGVIFGPQPRDYTMRINKKLKRKAIKIALSKKLQAGELEIIREFPIPEPKTKPLLQQLDPENKRVKTLIVSGEMDENAKNNMLKSLRNVPFYKILKTDGLNVYDLVDHSRIILLEKSIAAIQRRLAS